MEEIILKRKEFEEELVELINNSNLPAFVLKPIIKDLFEQLNILDQQQLEQAKKMKQEEQAKKIIEEKGGNE